FFACLPRKLGRAMVALFAVMLGAPLVIGRHFWKHWTDGDPIGSALTPAVMLGLLYSIVVVAIVFVLWWIGGLLSGRATRLLGNLLYVVAFPLFLAPFLIKKDLYMMLGMPSVYGGRWIILALIAVGGLAYVLIRRPRDEWGYAPGDNPWEANSLEWTI